MTLTRQIITLLLALGLGISGLPARSDLPRLQISPENPHFLATVEGEPFFWLGDTAWMMIPSLSLEEANHYFADRAAKGFNIIQAVVLMELSNRPKENAVGQRPFVNDDPAFPNEGYFAHMDAIVAAAADHGLRLAIIPCWGTFISPKGKRPMPDFFNPETVESYGRYLGNRYGHWSHVIWVIGGDIRPRFESDTELWRLLAKGVTRGVTGGELDHSKTLMAFHPPGGTYRPPATSSGEFFHDEPWLDFNMIQSGHRFGNRNYERITEDWNRVPVRPTMESEPCYEDSHHMHKKDEARFNDWHVRRRLYWSVFAGGAGATYGHGAVWGFFDPTDGKPDDRGFTTKRWQDALNDPGAGQMKHLRALIESRPQLLREPDQTLIAHQPESPDAHLLALRAKDGSYAMVYGGTGEPMTLNIGKLAKSDADRFRVSWFDPRTGRVTPTASVGTKSPQAFQPPSAQDEQDWVLILDRE
ncbi:MAG: glycoside hydrolase family 140 protein [Synoicihabitans sp.]